MIGVCYSLVQQLRAEPVVSTVPPGVRTVVATMLPPATGHAAPPAAVDDAAVDSAGTRTYDAQDTGACDHVLVDPSGR